MMDGYQSMGTQNYHLGGEGDTRYSVASVSVFVGLHLAEFAHCDQGCHKVADCLGLM
jgi:hypothetical protein